MANAAGDGQDRPSGLERAPRGRPAAVGVSPTVRQRELGSRLRELRTRLGLTVEDVAERLLCSASKISRLETGKRTPSLRDVRDLCQLYEVDDPAHADYLMSLARQAREPGWWTRYDDLNLEPYIGLEQAAVAITSFAMYSVPALLQTSEYARAIIRGIARRMDPKIVDQRVEARIRRQQLLEMETPPGYRAILDEAVLHRQVGGPAVLQAQLDKIVKFATEERAAVQVIPFDAGAHAGIDSNFDLLEFGESSAQGPVVYVEGLLGGLYQERPAEIRRYREAIEYLRDTALSTRDSVALMKRLRSAP